MCAKLHFNLKEGIVEVENSDDEFVRGVYNDFKRALTGKTPSPNIPARNKQEAVDGQLTLNGAESSAEDPTDGDNKKRQKRKTSKNATIIKDLDLSNRANKMSLREFYNKSNPRNDKERNLVFVYYVIKYAGVSKVTPDHIFSCYKDLEIRAPENIRQSIANTAYQGLIDASDLEAITTSVRGDNLLELTLLKNSKDGEPK